MYCGHVTDIGILMPQFYIIFIQGSELIKAAGNGDTATVERLLKRNPHLINYKGSVRRVKERSIYTYMHASCDHFYFLSRIIYVHISPCILG